MSETLDGRFTAPDRSMAEEDRIVLTSVGVDIGSSTTQLLFSRLELEREDARYVTTKREVLYESQILLTPYRDDVTIDGQELGRFVEEQYHLAGINRVDVDTGALILTGIALRRRNARAIADLFAQDAGRFVAVSAGDNLEATMAAHGSGAVALSETVGTVMNIDIGGGTTKVAICRDGHCAELMAMDVGARLVTFDEYGAVTRVEEAGQEVAGRVGVDLALGRRVPRDDLRSIASYLVDQLVREVGGNGGNSARGTSHLLRTAPLSQLSEIRAITFSGGVSEFVHGRAKNTFGDLGALLGEEINARRADLAAPIHETPSGIRATVIGASQYTIQVSGNTIFVAPLDVLPVHNVPVVMPLVPWTSDELEPGAVADAVRDALRRFDLAETATPVAIAVRWKGSATYERLRAFCTGVLTGMKSHVERGQPLIMVLDSDIGGLLGLHFREEMGVDVPIVSIDHVELREFDYIDIGTLIPTSGAVPVVIKSLVFPTVQ